MMLGFNDWFAHDTTASLSVDWYLYFSLALTTVNIASSGGLERCPLWVTAIINLVLSGRNSSQMVYIKSCRLIFSL